MRVDIFTIFPDIFTSYFANGIVSKAIKTQALNVVVHDIRNFAQDARKSVDDTPYGGGPGMVFKVEPIYFSLQNAKRMGMRGPVFYLSPKGKVFTQKIANQLVSIENFGLLCGRYEGVDERAVELCSDEISVGDFILTGGEAGVIVILDTVARLLPGILGNRESLGDESFSNDILEYPQYTRPEVFLGKRVPDILLSGDHGKICEFRLVKALVSTIERRPDLFLKRGPLSDREVEILEKWGYSNYVDRLRRYFETKEYLGKAEIQLNTDEVNLEYE